jgi:RNA polymerase sigma factor (sigma-70 family)
VLRATVDGAAAREKPLGNSTEAMSLTAIPGPQTAAPSRRPHLGTLSTCTLRHAGDDLLVTLTRGGSERAFAEIMRRYERQLHYYCLQMVGAPRAEDAVQQAFMQAFVALRDGERREIALRPWLYRIARNCAIDLMRKQHEHDELDPDFDGMSEASGVFEQKEELARVVAAIQALPDGQRRALTLRELEGRSYGEISAELGHTDSGVRQLIFRARTALRNLGALVLPLGSTRWRILSAHTAAAADPHGVAVAAGVSSGGGGSALQAAGTVVAATLTLLGAPGTAPRHHVHASARPALVATASLAAPATSTVVPTAVGAPQPRSASRASHVSDPPKPTVVELVVPPAAPVQVTVSAPAPATPAAPTAPDQLAVAVAPPAPPSQAPVQVATLDLAPPSPVPTPVPAKSTDSSNSAANATKPAPATAPSILQPKQAAAPKAPKAPAAPKTQTTKPAPPKKPTVAAVTTHTVQVKTASVPPA